MLGKVTDYINTFDGVLSAQAQEQEKEKKMSKNKKHSIGSLRPVEKTQELSPDLIGKITLKPELIRWLAEQLARTGGSATVNAAGWFNDQGFGRYISVIVSPPFVRKKKSQVEPLRQPPTLETFFTDEEAEDE